MQDELDELADEELTEKDKALLNAYSVSCHIDAMMRLDRSRVAYDVAIRAMRVCRLLALGAPAVIVRNEASLLAQAMTVRDHVASVETVVVKNNHNIRVMQLDGFYYMFYYRGV